MICSFGVIPHFQSSKVSTVLPKARRSRWRRRRSLLLRQRLLLFAPFFFFAPLQEDE